MTRTFEIVQQIVNAMDLTTTVEVDGSVLTTCNTLHVRLFSVVTDEADNTFRVTDFVNNESITVEALGAYTWTGTTLTAPTPTFLQGKWMSTNEEYLDLTNRSADKLPLIWLVRGYREQHFGGDSSIKMDVEPLIYFLDQARSDKWLNSEHDEYAVNPMYNLCKLFIETAEANFQLDEILDFNIEDEPRFGVKYSANKGNSKKIIDEDLSGVGLRIPLSVYGDCNNC